MAATTAVVQGRKRTSLVWTYFKYEAISDKSRCLVTIQQTGGGMAECGQLISGNNATNVRAHLRTAHKSQYEELLRLEEDKKPDQKIIELPMNPNSTTVGESSGCIKLSNKPLTIKHKAKTSPSITIAAAFDRTQQWPENSSEANSRKKALTNMIIASNMPMNVLSNEGFKEFCRKLDPKFRLPGKKSVAMCMNQMMADGITAIKQSVIEARRLSIGMDIWSKKGYDNSYLGITACFYHAKSNQPLHVLLNLHCISHPHTSEAIAEKLSKTILEFQIEERKILQIITDNGSNMVKAARILHQQSSNSITADKESDYSDSENSDEEEEDEQEEAIQIPTTVPYKRLPCLAHSLQLAIKVLERNPGYSNTVTKAKELTRKIRMSSVATQKLIDRCGKTVVSDCPTRWNSSYLMLKRLLDVKTNIGE